MLEENTNIMANQDRPEDMSIEAALDIITADGLGAVQLSNGLVCSIGKCKLRDSGKIISFLENTMEGLVEIGKMKNLEAKIEGEETLATILTRPSTTAFLKLVSNNFEPCAEAIHGLTNLTKDELLDLDMDDAIIVLFGIYKVNASFFIKRVVPLFTKLISTKSVDQ